MRTGCCGTRTATGCARLLRRAAGSRLRFALIACALAVVAQPLSAQQLDKHALASPAADEKSLDDLAAFLIRPAKTDADKIRAIFRWATDRISFDGEAYFAANAGDQSAEAVLKSRKGVCEGYANLVQQLGKRAGLEVERVDGVCRPIGVGGGKLASHVWNAVKIDGRWQLVDATWGAGWLEGKAFKKHLDDSYLLAAPERLILTHFPANDRWQLVDPAVARADFDAWPMIPRHLFQVRPDLDLLKLRGEIGKKEFKAFPTIYQFSQPYKLLDGPISGHLKAGQKYRFELDAPSYSGVAFMVNGKATPLERRGTHFEGRLTPGAGAFRLSARRSGDPPGRYTALMQYEAE